MTLIVDVAVEGLDNHIINSTYQKFCPAKIIKCKGNYFYNLSKVLLANIRTKKKLCRKYKMAKNKNPLSNKCKKIKVRHKFQEGIENKIPLMIYKVLLQVFGKPLTQHQIYQQKTPRKI